MEPFEEASETDVSDDEQSNDEEPRIKDALENLSQTVSQKRTSDQLHRMAASKDILFWTPQLGVDKPLIKNKNILSDLLEKEKVYGENEGEGDDDSDRSDSNDDNDGEESQSESNDEESDSDPDQEGITQRLLETMSSLSKLEYVRNCGG
ncbi:transcription initiation factor TFIID subunit 11-like [Orbicella faveolata]|uniref:transcription initiation factor TFIID subunit 11-like n=1 Tax=Orbicella faveolata TaxID=48498 RepID=UPI0009E62409|nr:transcription initiation factor TFIID subunit 11-like [Orbicella faveolata]